MEMHRKNLHYCKQTNQLQPASTTHVVTVLGRHTCYVVGLQRVCGYVVDFPAEKKNLVLIGSRLCCEFWFKIVWKSHIFTDSFINSRV